MSANTLESIILSASGIWHFMTVNAASLLLRLYRSDRYRTLYKTSRLIWVIVVLNVAVDGCCLSVVKKA